MTPDDDLQAEHEAYRDLAASVAEPDPDLPAIEGNDRVFEEYLPPRPQHEQRRQPEPEPQYQPQQSHQQTQQRQPEQRQPYNNAPDINDDPIGHFDTRLRNHEAWLQHQHAGDQGRQIWEHIDKSETAYRGELDEGEYDEATDHLKASRMQELQMQFPDTPQNQTLAFRSGFQSAAHMRQAQLQKDTVDVAMHAARNGMTPAEAYYALAMQRGFKPKAVMTKTFSRNVMRNIDKATPEQFDQFWQQFERVSKLREGQ